MMFRSKRINRLRGKLFNEMELLDVYINKFYARSEEPSKAKLMRMAKRLEKLANKLKEIS